MKTLLALILTLLPLSAFAQSDQFPFSKPVPHMGTTVIPDGRGNYLHQQTPGGLDAYGAMTMEQGLREMSRRAPVPIYQSPPLSVPYTPYSYRDPIREANDRFLEHR